jgi:molecular chaperone GrpE
VAAIVNDEKPENTIVEEISKGYMVSERVIKPAKVLVSKQSKGGNEDVENNRD